MANLQITRPSDTGVGEPAARMMRYGPHQNFGSQVRAQNRVKTKLCDKQVHI